MKIFSLSGAAFGMVTLLGACTGGLVPNPGVGPNGELPVIARAGDSGVDRVTLRNQQAAIAYDPDGCQNWLIDDGVEGYASRRRDPVSGLPICNNHFPPGTVVHEYRTNNIPDFIPRGPRR